jgi:hypothetical protein
VTVNVLCTVCYVTSGGYALDVRLVISYCNVDDVAGITASVATFTREQ